MAQRDVLPEPWHLSSKRPNDPSRRTFEKHNLARQTGQVTGWSQLRRQG